MHHSSSQYWSRNNSIEYSSFQKYQSEHPSYHNSARLRKESKVSPIVHKLRDPQRSNLPAQTYQRLCQFVPTPSPLHPITQEKVYNEDENSGFMSAKTLIQGHSNQAIQSHKVLSKQQSLQSYKTTPCSRKSSIKSPERSLFKRERHTTFEEEECSRDFSNVYKTPEQTYKHTEEYSGSPSANRAWRKKVSPKVSCFNNYGSTKTHLLQRPDQEQRGFYSQNIGQEASRSEHLTFRTNTATRVDTLNIDEDRGLDFEEYGEMGGFTTFRKVLNGKGIADDNEDQYQSRAETEGDGFASTRRKGFIDDKENSQVIRLLRSEEKTKGYHNRMKTSCFGMSSASKCNREDGLIEKAQLMKSRQMSMQWTPREKVVGSLDILSCSRVLFQSAKTERANVTAYKSEKSISTPCEDKEEAKLKKMIMELRKRVNEKDTELSKLKNKSKSTKMANDEIEAKLNQATMAKKRSDDTLEQITQQIACQEREKIFLSKCNERLESVLPNPADYDTNVESFLKKVRESEEILQQKKEEAKIVSNKVQQLEEQSQGKIEEQQNKDKTNLRKLVIEMKVRDQDIKQLKDAIEKAKISLKGLDTVGEKMAAVEDKQMNLIVENDRLKNILPENEKKKFDKYIEDKSISAMIIQTSSEVNAIDDYTKNMTKILEALLRGREPPVEALKLIPSFKKDRMKVKAHCEKIALAENVLLKDLTKANLELTEVVHHRFMKYMDDICEQYARVCGNHCNLQ